MISLPGAALSILGALPIVLLLGGLTLLKWSAPKAAVLSLALALSLAVVLFGLQIDGIVVAAIKGILLALYVLLVVWAALLLYSLADRLQIVRSIGLAIAGATHRTEIRALMIAWSFAGFLQGIAGFGAPVAAVVPLLRIAGFPPIQSIAAAMVGHSWAITFGSMGSSYFAIVLVSRLPGDQVAPTIAALFAVPILVTGASVLHLLTGWQGLWRAAPVLLFASAAIAGSMWVMAKLGAVQVASTVPALIGCALLWFAGRRAPVRSGAPDGESTPPPAPALRFNVAFLPYYLLIGLTLIGQIGPVSGLLRPMAIGFDLPPTVTTLGYQVLAESHYPNLRIFQHPAALIVLAIVGTALVYARSGHWVPGTLVQSLRATYTRSRATTQAVTSMVLMALIMNDSGMVRAMAEGLRTVAGPAFPLLSPFLGVLGAFMTGSNTNSNIAMGALQVETALALGIAPVLIAAAQSVGGALGSGISPDKPVIATAVAGVPGQEGTITRLALPYGLIAVACVGVEVLLASFVLGMN